MKYSYQKNISVALCASVDKYTKVHLAMGRKKQRSRKVRTHKERHLIKLARYLVRSQNGKY